MVRYRRLMCQDGEFVSSRDVFDEDTERRMDREDLAKQRARMSRPAVEHPLDPSLPLTAAAEILYDPVMAVRESWSGSRAWRTRVMTTPSER